MSKKVGFIFPGQGSQSVGMGKSFFDNSDSAKQIFSDAKEATGIDFEELMFEKNDNLGQTEFTQPAILLVSAIAHRLFEEKTDIKPTFVLGHSLGEFSALVATGALSVTDGVKLVNARGKLMQKACADIDAGMMAVIGLGDDAIESVCSDAQSNGKSVYAANYNSDGQVVVAGLKKDLEETGPIFKENKAKRALLLDMSVASHCPLLSSAQEPLKEMMQEMIKDEFIAPVVSNVTATTYNSKDEAVSLLTEQLVKPVLYKQSIEAIANDVDVLIEFGNGNVLKGLNKRIVKNLETFNVSDMDSLEATVLALKWE